MSYVTEFPAAEPQEAVTHFLRRLSVETDCAEPPSSSTPSQTVSAASSGNIFGRHSSDSAGPSLRSISSKTCKESTVKINYGNRDEPIPPACPLRNRR